MPRLDLLLMITLVSTTAIYVERGGATDAGALLKEFGSDELVKYAIWSRELHTRGAWIDRYERLRGRRIKGITIVYDLQGLGRHHLNPKVLDVFRDIMQISQDHYPGKWKVCLSLVQ